MTDNAGYEASGTGRLRFDFRDDGTCEATVESTQPTAPELEDGGHVPPLRWGNRRVRAGQVTKTRWWRRCYRALKRQGTW